MRPDSLVDDIEAFLARQNDENDIIAFNDPRHFSCMVMLQPQGARGTFSVDEEGIDVRCGERWYTYPWAEIFQMRMNPHSVKLFLRYEPVVTIHGAVRAAILGLFHKMEHE
jgi:hypothetical protein